MKEALRTKAFWGLSIGDALAGFVFSVFNIHMVFYLTQDLGSDDQATNVYSVFQMCVAFGVLLFGPMVDRFDLRKVIVLCYFLPALGTSFLIPQWGVTVALLAAVVAGLAGGGRTALFPVALNYGFGDTHMAAIYGMTNSLFMVGTALGPLIGGFIYDSTESTRVVYTAAILTLVFSAAFVSMIRNETRSDLHGVSGVCSTE